MYTRVLRPGETLRTNRMVVPHDPLNATTYLYTGFVVLLIRDGTAVAMSMDPFGDDPVVQPLPDAG